MTMSDGLEGVSDPFRESGKGIVVSKFEPGAMVGAVVWWRLSGEVKYAVLEAAWRAAGLSDKLLPGKPSELVVLKRVMEENFVRGASTVVRPLDDKQGYALMRKGKDAHGKPQFTTVWTAVVVGELLEVDGLDDAAADDLRGWYSASKERLLATDLGTWLSGKVVPECLATRLRDTGGIYFIPEPGMALWRATRGIVGRLSRTMLEEVPAMRTEEAVQAILRSLSDEVADATRKLDEEIDGWLDDPAKKFVIDRRQKDVIALRDKVEKYEQALGVSLGDLRARQDAVNARLTLAAMAAGA